VKEAYQNPLKGSSNRNPRSYFGIPTLLQLGWATHTHTQHNFNSYKRENAQHMQCILKFQSDSAKRTPSQETLSLCPWYHIKCVQKPIPLQGVFFYHEMTLYPKPKSRENFLCSIEHTQSTLCIPLVITLRRTSGPCSSAAITGTS